MTTDADEALLVTNPTPRNPVVLSLIHLTDHTTAEICCDNLADDPYVILTDTRHGTTIINWETWSSLHGHVDTVTAVGNKGISQLRMNQHLSLLAGRLTMVSDGDYEHVLVRAGQDPDLPGTMTITWVDDGWPNDQIPGPGWVLNLTGRPQIFLGFADWNDPQAITALADAMFDTDAMLALAGLLAPEAARVVTSRMRANEHFQLGRIPYVTEETVRHTLHRFGIHTPVYTTPLYAPLIRMLTMRIAGNSIPVAFAIAPPVPRAARYGTNPSLYATEKALVDNWATKLTTALQTAGWTLVALPTPRQDKWFRNAPVIWATLLTPDIWVDVLPAATHDAPYLGMTEGTKF